MKLIIHPYKLELEHTFIITHESRNFQNSIIVELQQEGFSGFGEAAATAYYGQTMEGMIEKLLRDDLRDNLPPTHAKPG